MEPRAGARTHGRVVVGVDGSDGARAALVWGLGEAARRGADLTVLTAFPVDVYWTDAQLLDPRRIDAARQRTADRVHAVLDDVSRDPAVTPVPGVEQVRTSVVVAAGAPGEHLVRETAPGDVLVVGSRGRGAVRSAVLGSVALRCVTHARCAVVVVHGPAVGERREPLFVVGVDGSAASAAALVAAADQAARRGARLRAVTVAEPPDPWMVADGVAPRPSDEVLAATRAVAEGAIADALGPDGPPVDLVVVEGVPADVLAAHSRDADLLVVGSRGRATLPGLLLGSVALRAVVRAMAPVMVVHPSPFAAGTATGGAAAPPVARAVAGPPR